MELKQHNTDALAEEYLDRLVAFRQNNGEQTDNFSKGDMETCYVVGFQAAQELHYGMFGNFGQALGSLRNGHFVTRAGWNGKGIYLWMRAGVIISKDELRTSDGLLINVVEGNGGSAEMLPTICMMTAGRKVLTGWLASQTDMMANDWYIVA